MHRFLLAAVLLLACASPSFAAGQLPPGISGAWYNPAQSGHGLSVEILDDDSAVVFWYAYDRSGKPLSLYVEAQIDDNALSGVALAPRGMRFGAFDSATIVKPAWGDIRIDFADCNTATLHYEAIDPAFGEGDIPLRRLTTLAERECPASFPNVLETGLYNASIGTAEGYEVRAAIDGDGVLHMVQHGRASNGVVTLVQENFNYPQYLATGTPVASGNTATSMFLIDLRVSNFFNTTHSSASRRDVLVVGPAGTGMVMPHPGTIPLALLGPSTRQLDDALTLDAIA